eukprot:3934457-Rhodomonas_salina.1
MRGLKGGSRRRSSGRRSCQCARYHSEHEDDVGDATDDGEIAGSGMRGVSTGAQRRCWTIARRTGGYLEKERYLKKRPMNTKAWYQ